MSVNRDPTTWRLTTLGGIPVRLENQTGSFEEENAQVTETYVMQSSRLLDFVVESFPPPVELLGVVQHPVFRGLPGLRSLLTRKVSYEGLSGKSKPIDPFGIDSDAPANTYEEFVRVTINYQTSAGNDRAEPDPNDPLTFLEISSNASGEFITTSPSGVARWDAKEGDSGSVEVADRNIPQTVRSPQVEWSVRWSQIPWSFFDSSLIATLRSKLGLINTDKMKLFFDAPADTILFVGYTFRQQFTWRTGSSGQPPVQLEMKFLEKNFLADKINSSGNSEEVSVTHQHFYRPKKGWSLLFSDGENLAFKTTDLDQIFLPA